ncbi:monooxygenase domain protein [Mycobacterium xenopi 3993]|nr:monooxygenase domain protein [Mycobacterium xenopi 3993]
MRHDGRQIAARAIAADRHVARDCAEFGGVFMGPAKGRVGVVKTGRSRVFGASR